jgi:hypothetical protein
MNRKWDIFVFVGASVHPPYTVNASHVFVNLIADQHNLLLSNENALRFCSGLVCRQNHIWHSNFLIVHVWLLPMYAVVVFCTQFDQDAQHYCIITLWLLALS